MRIKTYIKMVGNIVFGDGSFNNFTEKEQHEIVEYIDKREPKLEKYAKKLEDKTYKLSKKQWFRNIWASKYGKIEELDNFIEVYEKENPEVRNKKYEKIQRH